MLHKLLIHHTWCQVIQLNEHEILNAHKYENIKEFSFFRGSDKPRMLFFLLMNVKMPTIVGILTLMSRKSWLVVLGLAAL